MFLKKIRSICFYTVLLAFFFSINFASATFDTFTTIDCDFSTASKTISATAAYYSSNTPSCVSMKLSVAMPNGTTASYSATSCSSGVHSFSNIAAPVNGVYNLTASYSNSSASCPVAALFFESRPRLPELHPLAIVIVALAAASFLKNGFSKKSKPI